MKLRIALPLITLTLLLQGCKPDAEAPQVPVSRPVKLYTIATETHNTATLPGRLEAGQRAELAFEVAGRLVQLPAQEGQAIKAGQVLAQLDNRDFASKVRSAEAEYQRAHADYLRGQTLFNGKQAISRAELEKLRTQSAVAKSALEQARKALRDTQITAPFNGIVSRVLVNNHENINAKQPVVIVQDVSYFEIRLHVTERNLLERHDRNTPLFARIEGIPGREFALSFHSVAKEPDPLTGTYEVVLRMPAPADLNLFSGMTVTVGAGNPPASDQANAHWLIPAVAVLSDSDNGEHYVWRYNPTTQLTEKVPVKTGQIQGNNIEIISGLSAGEQIIIAGVHAVQAGMPVHPLVTQ